MRELAEEQPIDEVLVEITDIKLTLNLEADKEEIFWEQRVRVNWLKLGDRNTSFFHAVANSRKKFNKIYGLKDENGRWVEDKELVEVVSRYFQDLFQTIATDNCD